MKEIQLTHGKVCIVDDEDFERLSKQKWHVTRNGATFYARGAIRQKDNRWRCILMHRFILNISDKSVFVDHKNRDTLDNRKENLRLCSPAQNSWNRQGKNQSTSVFKGVSWYKRWPSWKVQIWDCGKVLHLGYFKDEVLAAKAYDEKAKEIHGEFAILNFKK